MRDRRSSFKRRSNPLSERSGNKRGRYGDQSPESSQASETVYRILCHIRKIGSVIGKGGGIVKSLREETRAKITIADSVSGSDERVILIYSPSSKKPVRQYSEDTGLEKNDMELHCAAQDALLRVHDRIIDEDLVDENDEETVVVARLLVPNNTVGCLLGRKGDIIERLRSETGATIKVFPTSELPICAMSTDELVQISATPSIAKRALYEVSTLLHLNPRKDEPPSGVPVPVRRPGPPIPPPANPMWSDRGRVPAPRWRGDYGGEPKFDGGPEESPAEFSMKILCQTAKIAAVIGIGGSNLNQLQLQTGTTIHVDDASADSEERVIRVSSFEALSNPRSRTIDAILFLQDKTSEFSEKGAITTRILIPSNKVGCILGQGGKVINEMRRRTKAEIKVFSKKDNPKCAGEDEELLQVSGSYGAAKEALADIASRYRARSLRYSKRAPGVFEPLKGGGSEHEPPPSYPAPSRDYEPYSHPAPASGYDPHGYQVQAPPRDYEPNTYPAPAPVPAPGPPMGYEPQGYPLPPNATGYPSSGQGSDIGPPGVGNASEMTGTIPMLQDPYGGGSGPVTEIHGSSQTLNSTHDAYQGQISYHAPPPEQPYVDINLLNTSYINATANPPYHLYQNNPPQQQQGHYSETPYQYGQ